MVLSKLRRSARGKCSHGMLVPVKLECRCPATRAQGTTALRSRPPSKPKGAVSGTAAPVVSEVDPEMAREICLGAA
jgi:hypothetical protein